MSDQSLIPNFEDKRREFLNYYEEKRDLFDSARKAAENLTRLLIEEAGFAGTKISSRTKDKNECIKKFELKERTKLEKDGLDYTIQDHIGDIIGLRLVCLYESDIPKITDLVRKEFKVLKEENKSADLNEKTKFGYKGVHIDVCVSDHRSKFPEYRRFEGLRIEIQVRSIVQDAWSEVDHKLKYKKQVPEEIKRRIIRLAALFELADQEFDEIRARTHGFEQKPQKAPEDVGPDDVLDSFSFSNFVQRRYKNYNFEAIKIDGFVDEIIEMNPKITLSDFQKIFNEGFDITQEFRQSQRLEGVNINPFTHMRHMLYLADSEKFADMLYPSQRDQFKRWVQEHATGGKL